MGLTPVFPEGLWLLFPFLVSDFSLAWRSYSLMGCADSSHHGQTKQVCHHLRVCFITFRRNFPYFPGFPSGEGRITQKGGPAGFAKFFAATITLPRQLDRAASPPPLGRALARRFPALADDPEAPPFSFNGLRAFTMPPGVVLDRPTTQKL